MKKKINVKTPAFQKMRRRLTVTSDSDTIDAVSRLSVSDKQSKHLTLTGDSDTLDVVSKQSVSVKQNKDVSKYNVDARCAVKKYSGISKKGYTPYNPRKKNQDALIMTDDPATNTLILCVLDGHGEYGDAVAKSFRDRLSVEMIKHPCWDTNVKKASADAIAKIENDVLRNKRIDTEYSGTTLTMAIIRGNNITGVNIGDSRAIIGTDINEKLVAEQFTHDHKPDSLDEKKRIINAGGRVFAVEYDDGDDGPPRVWLGHVDVPGLAMSRSLGDVVAHTAGVISEPEFSERTFDDSTDKFIVVASDGLWEFVDNTDVVEMISGTSNPTESVEILVKEANSRWIQEEQVIDDTTIIVAYLFDYKSS